MNNSKPYRIITSSSCNTINVDPTIRLRLNELIDVYLRASFHNGPFIAIHAADKYSDIPVYFWSRYHGRVFSIRDVDEFERTFLTIAEHRPILCVPFEGHRHDYNAYFLQTDPVSLVDEFTVADVLLT